MIIWHDIMQLGSEQEQAKRLKSRHSTTSVSISATSFR